MNVCEGFSLQIANVCVNNLESQTSGIGCVTTQYNTVECLLNNNSAYKIYNINSKKCLF